VSAAAPLAGVTVVELCQNVAGPFTGTILAQLGATVLKVERPGNGDDARGWGPPFVGEASVMFHVMNSGKRSLALDVTDEADRARLWSLLADADVLVENWRPGAVERAGFGYEAVAARCPRLVYCSISAYGTTGPLAAEPGYDSILQAFSGVMSLNGHEGDPPSRVGTSIIDMGAGAWALIGILAALLERKETGRGRLVQTSLLEAGLAWIPYQLAGHLVTGEEPARLGTGLSIVAPYRAYEVADGWLMLVAGNDAMWLRLCEALGRGDLAAREDLRTNEQRLAARAELDATLAETLLAHPRDHWIQRLQDAGVPCSPIHGMAEVAAHPQTEAIGMVAESGGAEPLRKVALPLRFDGTRPPVLPAPPLGGTAVPAGEGTASAAPAGSAASSDAGDRERTRAGAKGGAA
jgi:crotonobetainyl-CoA:carnitine CoA-transferase CaiB-like acyl-CoA transferase